MNDHDQLLRGDPLLAGLAEKPDPSGESRARERDQGKVLAGKSTLNRLELPGEAVSEEERYKKIALEEAAVDRLLVQVSLQAHRKLPQEIVLDSDATDDPLHGNQQGQFFHGYYGHYCPLPLHIFCGDFLLGARCSSSSNLLRPTWSPPPKSASGRSRHTQARSRGPVFPGRHGDFRL